MLSQLTPISGCPSISLERRRASARPSTFCISIYIRSDPNGSYTQSIAQDDFTVEIEEMKTKSLIVSYHSRISSQLYFVVILFAFLTAISTYQVKKTMAKEEENDISFSNPDPPMDPIYEAFLQEDTDRRLFPRPELEEEFQSWKSKRSDDHESEA